MIHYVTLFPRQKYRILNKVKKFRCMYKMKENTSFPFYYEQKKPQIFDTTNSQEL